MKSLAWIAVTLCAGFVGIGLAQQAPAQDQFKDKGFKYKPADESPKERQIKQLQQPGAQPPNAPRPDMKEDPRKGVQPPRPVK